ncbi:MAG: phosphatidylserine decarboxylase [Sulfurimonadaceae bacterium]|nr:phosphatidylserine decarboxylase [Sulfurimonadaceae bacterium]
MMRNNLYPVAKGGFRYIFVAVILFFIFHFFSFHFLEFFSFLAILFFIYIFRNPERMAQNYEPKSVASPADGTVISIEEIEEEGYKYKVTIDSSYLDVSLLRAPMSATFTLVKTQKGTRLSQKYSTLAAKLNSSISIVFKNITGNKIKVLHTLKQSFEEISLDAQESQSLLQGARYGSMVYGTTTLYLPENFRLNIQVGSQVAASDTLIGYFS